MKWRNTSQGLLKLAALRRRQKVCFQTWKDIAWAVWQRECITAQKELSTNTQAHNVDKCEYDGHALLGIWIDSFDIVTMESCAGLWSLQQIFDFVAVYTKQIVCNERALGLVKNDQKHRGDVSLQHRHDLVVVKAHVQKQRFVAGRPFYGRTAWLWDSTRGRRFSINGKIRKDKGIIRGTLDWKNRFARKRLHFSHFATVKHFVKDVKLR